MAIYVHALAADGVLKDAYVSAKIGANITDLDPNHVTFDNSYFGGNGSYKLSNDKQTLASGSVAFGWNLEPSLNVPVRTKLELSAQQDHQFDSKTAPYITYNDGFVSYNEYLKDSVKLQQQSVMWNTYFDWKNTTKFTPYFAVGVGATRIHTKGTLSDNSVSGTFSEDFAATSKTDFNFIWSVGIGTSYAITPNLAADLSYKYIDSGKLKLNYSSSNGFYTGTQESSYNLRAHNLALGLRYSF
ncbi:outer membrane protein [Acinetobacter brisouii]|uniref:outer membrane protein n=1 Tax=Acinetobacter brisouii TaxID=396323 RepID=UPI000A799177|nr:outer membrane beta-barrel protein [Acinetobacter brisouii]